MNASMEDAKAKLGTALLPILTVAAQKLAGLAQWIQQNSSWLVPLIAAIAAVAAVILVMNGVLTAYNVIAGIGAVATGALVGPILLVIAAIAAIIAIIVLLVKNWEKVKQAGAAAAEWIKDKWNGLMGWIRGIPGMISGYFNNAIDLLKNAGMSIINGFFNGLKSAWNKVTGWISGIGDWIKDHKGPESYDAQLLVDNGYVTMQGFGKGLSQGYESAVVPQVTSVAGKISSLIGQQRFDVPTVTANASLSGTDSLARIAASARKQADTIIIVEKLDVKSSGNLDNDETASKIVDSLNEWATVRGKGKVV
jgi:phage-related protein